MNWGDIGQGIEMFFAAAGAFAFILIVIAAIGIQMDDHKARKATRKRREDNWDRQGARIDRLVEDMRDLRSLVSAIDMMQDKDSARIDQLFKAGLTVEMNVVAHDEILLDHTNWHSVTDKAIERIDLGMRESDDRVTALEDKQDHTDTWQSITDDELLRIYDRLHALETKERAA